MKSAFGNIKVALDTNILSYLLDNTYPNLNKFIQNLSDCDLVDLVCSQFVIYELIEIRKLEHYIRLIHKETTKGGGSMNFSSILKYRKDWSAPELDYKNIFIEVKDLVEKDIEKIWDDYGIEFNDESIHKDLWNPHKDLVLTSKISKEDSLVLLSSVYPEPGKIEDYLIFLTNDDKFFRAFAGNGKDKIEELDTIFTENNITKPIVLKIPNIELPHSRKTLDLVKEIKDEEEIKQYVNEFIFEHFKEKNSDYLLGKIISCECSDKKDMFCFFLEADQLNKDIYLSVLTKDLKIINIPDPQSNFWAYGEIKNYPYLPNEEKTKKISIKLLNKEGVSLIREDKLNEIMVNGNLVFIHSDTYRV